MRLKPKSRWLPWQLLLTLFLCVSPRLARPDDSGVITATAPTSVATPQLTAPARQVLKLVTGGVPEEVIQTYIKSSDSTFNLVPETIVQLQQAGVSAGITSEMLSHDKAFRDQAMAAAQAQAQAAATANASASTVAASSQPQLVSDVEEEPITVSPDEVYNNLLPYGAWNEMPGYGPYWQPYPWIDPNAYAYAGGWLAYGDWAFLNNQGWCWFPSGRLNRFNGFGTFQQFEPFRGNNGFGVSRFDNPNNFPPFRGENFLGNPFFPHPVFDNTFPFGSLPGVGGVFPSTLGGNFNGSGLGGNFNRRGLGGNFRPDAFNSGTSGFFPGRFPGTAQGAFGGGAFRSSGAGHGGHR